MLGIHTLLALSSAGLVLQPSTASVRLQPRGATHSIQLSGIPMSDSDLSSDNFRDSFGGCKEDRTLDLNGVALAGLGTYLWYLGSNTATNKDREKVEGPGVRRRNLLLVLSLQGAAALARGQTAKVCSEEEFKERNERVLEQKKSVGLKGKPAS